MKQQPLKNMELREQIKEILVEERNRKLNESFVVLNDIRDENFILEKYFEICSNLIQEGYTIDEIENSEIKNSIGSIDWSDAMKQGALSAGKEYAIRFILTNIFQIENENLKTVLSKVLADLNPLDLIRIFKDESNCNKYFPNIVNIMLELIVRKIGSDSLGVDSNSYTLNPFKGGFRDIITNYGGNISGEIIRKTDISEKISSKFCKFVH